MPKILAQVPASPGIGEIIDLQIELEVLFLSIPPVAFSVLGFSIAVFLLKRVFYA